MREGGERRERGVREGGERRERGVREGGEGREGRGGHDVMGCNGGERMQE